METSILRKPLHILLVLAMTASLLATAAVGSFAQTFDGLPPDVDPDGPFAEAVEWAVAEDLTRPFPDDEFKGTRDITRAALATWYYRLAGEPDGPFEEPAAIDVDEDTNFYTEISWALENGVMNVFPDGNFNPNRATVRQAAAAITFQNAGSPEGDFAQLAFDAFPDVDENTTFANEIGWLVANGYTEAFDDGEWKPNRDVSRFAMAAWFFRIYAEVEVPVDTLRVVAADTGDDLVYLSDGDAVTEYTYTGDSFEIDGVPSTKTAFEAFLNSSLVNPDVAQVEIETTVSGDVVTHNVAEGDVVLSGVVGVDNGGGYIFDFDPTLSLGIALVDGASGVALTAITPAVAGLAGDINVTYSVDGTSASQTLFLNNLSSGDMLTAVILATDDDGVPTAIRHDLVNQDLTGVSLTDVLPLTVDPNADDDADADTLPLMPLFPEFAIGAETDAIYTINGETEVQSAGDPFAGGLDVGDDYDADSFNLALEVGFAVSFGYENTILSYEVTTEALPSIEGVVVGEDAGDIVLSTSATDTAEVPAPAGADSTLVDGLVATGDEFNDEVSVGDVLVYQPADPAFGISESWSLTNGTISDAQVVSKTPAPVGTVQLANDYLWEVEVVPFGYAGQTALFTLNGEEATQAEFLAALDATNIVQNTVLLSLDPGTATEFTWDLSGIPAANLP